MLPVSMSVLTVWQVAVLALAKPGAEAAWKWIHEYRAEGANVMEPGTGSYQGVTCRCCKVRCRF